MLVNVGVMTFRLYSIPVRCGNIRFSDQNAVNFSHFGGNAGMEDSVGCKRNSFARSIVTRLQILSEMVESFTHIGLVLSEMHS